MTAPGQWNMNILELNISVNNIIHIFKVFCNDLIFPDYRQRSVLLMEARKSFSQYWSILTQGSVLLLQ